VRIVTAPLAAVAVLAAAAACGEDEPGSADPSSLEGTAWLLASGVDGEDWEDIAPTATFVEGTVRGSGRRTPWTREPSRSTPPAATKKACAEPDGIMEQEAAFLAVLPLAARYEVTAASLDLLTDEGTFVATFTRAPGQ
jgi:hypothetical protein